MSTTRTDMAIDAFRELERVQFLLERKQYALEQALAAGDVDLQRYAQESEQIRREFAEKRETRDRPRRRYQVRPEHDGVRG